MSNTAPYDALLLVSFGGPEGPDDVVPFLENVTHGRGIPPERLKEVGAHYFEFGGVSPINQQCRDLIAALRQDFADTGLKLPIYWGNRNWNPFLADTLAEMEADGVRRALVVFTSAYSSYSGCRQYREDLARALAESGTSIQFDKVRPYFNDPGFVEPMADAVSAAVAGLPEAARIAPRLVFVTHSLPRTYAETAGPAGGAYVAQHLEVARLVAEGVSRRTGLVLPHELVFCSRSGPPQMPWLEPDINDHLRAIKAQDATGAVLAPIGFVSDHMEVIYDLDTQAAETALEIDLPTARAATVGTDPRFVAALRRLVLERSAVARGDSEGESLSNVVGRLRAFPDVCPLNCCPNPRAPLPAVAGED
ncbi:ferrochelatase [Catenulispora pinisilvae]|uniref:ferrochelatase n=1 Tax=Catenulispora pinisilvae TaxID=2705253 RepID=UPI0018914999|nr:ferrochelatase [Catenulispora pinisilvae]